MQNQGFIKTIAKLIASATLPAVIVTTCVAQAPPSVSFVARMDFPVGQDPRAIATGDLDSDGKVDLVTANYGSNDVSVLLGNGDGTFKPAVNYPVDVRPFLVMVADLNGDGKLDILTANQGNSSSCAVCSVSISSRKWYSFVAPVFHNRSDGTYSSRGRSSTKFHESCCCADRTGKPSRG